MFRNVRECTDVYGNVRKCTEMCSFFLRQGIKRTVFKCNVRTIIVKCNICERTRSKLKRDVFYIRHTNYNNFAYLKVPNKYLIKNIIKINED